MGYITTDQVDLNEVYYNTIVPSIDRYNQYDYFPFREYLSSNGDESWIKYPITKITFASLGEAETPSASKLQYARFRGTTAKTGAAFGYTLDFLADASRKQIDDTQAEIYKADRLAVQNKILSACLDGTTAGGFWNAVYDSEADPKAYGRVGAPPDYGQNTFNSNHNHYQALNTTAVVLTHITNAKQHIVEHGPITRLVGFINSVEVETFENLAGWYQANTTLIPNKLTDAVAIDGFQNRFLGIDWYSTEAIPAGYIVIADVGSGGDNDKVVKFIEKANSSFRGLMLFPGSTVRDYPIIDSYFLRWMGSKVWRRGAGYVMQALSGASYTTPTLL